MPDYPHDEVKNSGVNHFPDGVFQKCRYVSAKEREAERERIKRLRRLKNRNSITPVSSDIDNFDSTWDDALVSVSRPGPGQESTPNSAGQRSLSTFAHPRGFVVGFDDSFATLTNLSSRTRTSIVQSANSASTVDSSATSSPSPSLRGNNTGLGLNIPVPQTANAAAGPATPVSSSPQTPGNRRSMLTPPQDHSSPLNRQNNGDNTQQRPRAMTNVPQSQSPSPSTPGAVMIQQQSPTPMRQPLRAQAARSRIGVTSTAHSIPGQQSRR